MRGTQGGLFDLSDREVAGALVSVAAAARSVVEQERRAVAQAREHGWSWEKIGAHLSLTGETVRRRYGGVEARQVS